MLIDKQLSDKAVLLALGHRLSRLRIDRNMTQAQLAFAAGVSKRTLERLEDGGSVQLANLVRCLRALERIEALEAMLPETTPSPLELLENAGKVRQRVKKSVMPVASTPWTWGEEQ